MNFIGHLASTMLFNRFSQSALTQSASIGLGCIRAGKHLFCDPKPHPSPAVGNIGRKITGAALLAVGSLVLYRTGKVLLGASFNDLRSEFLCGNPPTSIPEAPYGGAFKKAPEILYLGADPEVDPFYVLSPKWGDSLPKCLAAISTLKYKTIRHPFQICEEIKFASKPSLEMINLLGENHQSAPPENFVQDLVIGAHGSGFGMAISSISSFNVFDPLPSNCFDGLSPNAKIFLQSCSTGKSSLWKPNFAEWLSWISGREVVAPTNDISAFKCSMNPNDHHVDIKLTGMEYIFHTEENREKLNHLADHEIIEASRLMTTIHGEDYTKHFKPPMSLSEKATFFMKFAIPALLGAMTAWQTARFTANIARATGTTIMCVADKGAAPIKKLAKKSGLYNPIAAQMIYTATKRTGQILDVAGRSTHKLMDTIIKPLDQLSSWVFRKSATMATSAIRGICLVAKAAGMIALQKKEVLTHLLGNLAVQTSRRAQN